MRRIMLSAKKRMQEGNIRIKRTLVRKNTNIYFMQITQTVIIRTLTRLVECSGFLILFSNGKALCMRFRRTQGLISIHEYGIINEINRNL